MAGLIHIYCGDGKGKTTAAVGLAVRASGRGMPVVLTQFLKTGNSGELAVLSALPCVRVLRGAETAKFLFRMSDEEKADYGKRCCELFEQACACCESGGLLVLDEALDAVDTGMISEAALLEFLRNRPEGLEVVLTGRQPTPAVADAADYITRMQKIKHPYDKGAPARRGIEF